jgi:hypothetical protein
VDAIARDSQAIEENMKEDFFAGFTCNACYASSASDG